jgi:hypothetical protein
MDEVQARAAAKSATSIQVNAYEFDETEISFCERPRHQTLSRKMSRELANRSA